VRCDIYPVRCNNYLIGNYLTGVIFIRRLYAGFIRRLCGGFIRRLCGGFIRRFTPGFSLRGISRWVLSP